MDKFVTMPALPQPQSSTTSVNILDYIYLPKVVKNYIGAPLKGHWLLFDIEAKRNYSNDQFKIYLVKQMISCRTIVPHNLITIYMQVKIMEVFLF